MAIMTGRVTARIGSGKGGEVRAKEGRRQISALGSSISEYSRHKNPANSFALVSGSRSGLHDEPHCTSLVGDRGTCKARKLFLWRREELPAKLAQVHSEERMEIMIARLVCPVRVGVGMAARKGARGCVRPRAAGCGWGENRAKKFFLRGSFCGAEIKMTQ